MVDRVGIEPTTYCLQGSCSPNVSYRPKSGWRPREGSKMGSPTASSCLARLLLVGLLPVGGGSGRLILLPEPTTLGFYTPLD